MTQLKEFDRIIIGIDPGTNILGFGVIGINSKGPFYKDMGVFDLRKWEVKRILNTMRTPYNEKEVNLVLARVDMTPDFRLEKLIAEFGNDKNAVIQYFQC